MHLNIYTSKPYRLELYASLGSRSSNELLMFDPEPRDMYHCHLYLFVDICISLVNEPIGPIGYSILIFICPGLLDSLSSLAFGKSF